MAQLILRGTTGTLPTSTFDLMDHDEKVGILQLRHAPSHATEIPPQMASHVYYEIDSKFQGKGYGTEILRLGLEEAKKIGLHEILVTCDEDNLASKKIIEANGGVFVEEAVIPSTGKKMFKYRIAL